MDLDESQNPKGIFECQLCKLAVPYTYFGQKPPNTRSIILLEECYVMRDPFVPDKEKFLILGSPCSLCERVDCSLFYSKRFCLPCVSKNKDTFPLEIQQDLDKRKAQAK
ncbi:hypothetical protein GDO78_006561 [Eleutherodactylus coqui]|uniref:Cysteine-rich DPF motif domain-containing protein 1 n=1 Tax=Eleutherodactylus coqui TaxID=57060 RepID=A0A8J6KGZ5_ELECQ|nr:hypothetical protein GDO78_006561 [Eleutherodactylus coqui]